MIESIVGQKFLQGEKHEKENSTSLLARAAPPERGVGGGHGDTAARAPGDLGGAFLVF